MKVIVNARFLTQELTGVQRYAIECSMQIKQTTNEAIFVSPKNIRHPELAAALGVIPFGKLEGHLWEQIELYQYLRKEGNPPLLNLGNTGPVLYGNNYSCIHDLAFFHRPDWNSRMFGLWYRFLIPRLARKAKHIFTVSNSIKDEIEQVLSIDGSKISLTYNGIANAFQNQNREVKKRKQLLVVGTFNRRKNHDVVIMAFLASPIAADYKLIIAGDRVEISKQFKVVSLDQDLPNVQIIDRPDDLALIRLYQESEMLVSLSSYEGFGLPVLEGLYFGCKVICSDIPSYRELFINCVYFCDTFDTNEIGLLMATVSNADVSDRKPSPDLFELYNYARSASHILQKISGN